MARRWTPRLVRGGRSRFGRPVQLPPNWSRYRHRRFRGADLRVTAWLGLLLGLLAFQALRIVAAPPPPNAVSTLPVATDPYAESRRSREILAEQEAPPRPIGRLSTAEAGATRAEPVAVRVIDGDAFDYAGMRVRVADIDTPELRGRCDYEIALARRATRRMEVLLAAGPFELERPPSGRDEDRYGRKLRIVTRHGRSLGDELVAEGLARTWSGRREPWC